MTSPQQAEIDSKSFALGGLSTLCKEVIALQQGAILADLFCFTSLVTICSMYCGKEDPVQVAQRVVTQAALAYSAGSEPVEGDETFDQASKGLAGASKLLKRGAKF
jgi:hypothetical protein